MNYITEITQDNEKSYKAIVEISKGSKLKTELQAPKFNELVIATKMSKKYPYYYGCFPQTLANDGDALDMILLTNKEYKLLDIVDVVPLGYVITIDENKRDYKILVKDINEELPNEEKLKQGALNFLLKVVARTNTIVENAIHSKEEAIDMIEYSKKAYLDNKYVRILESC